MGEVKDHTRFDFGTLTEREKYKLLIGTVIPRPIALVTTLTESVKTGEFKGIAVAAG